MSELISKQSAINAMCLACGHDCDKSEFVYDAPQDEQVIMCPEHYALSTLPSAVVRCKDCKNCKMGVITAQYSDGNVKVENLCYRNKWSVRGTDYCSYAEPKE